MGATLSGRSFFNSPTSGQALILGHRLGLKCINIVTSQYFGKNFGVCERAAHAHTPHTPFFREVTQYYPFWELFCGNRSYGKYKPGHCSLPANQSNRGYYVQTNVHLVLLVLSLAACQTIPLIAAPNSPRGVLPTPVVSTLPVPPPRPPWSSNTRPAGGDRGPVTGQGHSVDQIQLASTEAVDWRDGCLEVVFPGAACLQAIVPGYKMCSQPMTARMNITPTRTGPLSSWCPQQPYVLPCACWTARCRSSRSASRHPAGAQTCDARLHHAAGRHSPRGSLCPELRGHSYGDATDASGTRTLDFIHKPNYGWQYGPGCRQQPVTGMGHHLTETQVASCSSAPRMAAGWLLCSVKK